MPDAPPYTSAELTDAKAAATHQDWVRAVREKQAANQRSGWTPRRKRTGY